jgi:hypothetical protein
MLSIVRTVVILAVLVLAGAGVVTTDNEVGRTVVLADDGVPDSLTGTTHAHGEGKKGEGGHAVRVAGQEGLVDTDTGEVVNVTRLGQANDGVDENVGLLGPGGANGKLTVSAVHGVASLESNDLLPAELVEVGAELRRSESEIEEVIMLQAVDSLNLATDVELLSNAEEVLDTRVGVIVAAEDLNGLLDLVRPVDIVDGQDSEVVVIARIAQGDASTGLDTKSVDLCLVDVEGNGHGEEDSAGEAVVGNDTVIVGLRHKSFEGGKAAIEDQFEIAKVTLAQNKGRKVLGLGEELVATRAVAREEVLEDATVGRVGHDGCDVCRRATKNANRRKERR